MHESITVATQGLRLSKFAQHSVNRVEGRVYLFPDLIGTRRGKKSVSGWGSNRFHCTHDKNADNAIISLIAVSTPHKVALDLGQQRMSCRKVKRNDGHLCTSQDDLARHEYQQHDLRLNHAIYETRKQLAYHNQIHESDNNDHVPQAHSY